MNSIDLVIFKARRIDNSEWIYGTSIVVFVDDGELNAYMPKDQDTCIAVHDVNDNINSLKGMMYKIDYSSLELYKNEFVEQEVLLS